MKNKNAISAIDFIPLCAQFSTNGFDTLLEFQGLLENPKVMSHLKKVHSKLEREKK